MKKLTAGIFTVMLGLCATSGAEAAVASKGYVDSKVGENTTAIETLTQTVETNATTAADATADVAKDLADYEVANDARVLAVEGEVDTLQTAVGNAESGLVKNVADLSTLVGDKSVSEQIADAVTGGTLDLSAYAKSADLQTTNANVQENAEAIAANETAIETNATNIATNTSAIATLNGDATTTGSVAKSIADAFTTANLSQYATTEAMDGALSAYTKSEALGALALKDTVATADIDDGAVTTAKLADGAVDASKLGANAVTDAAVADDALSQDKIKDLDTTLATKMTITNATSETGKYVFTANVGVNGVTDYAWELIERGTTTAE